MDSLCKIHSYCQECVINLSIFIDDPVFKFMYLQP